MRIAACVSLLVYAVLFGGCSSPLTNISNSEFGIESPPLFRGSGTVRLFDMDSRGGVMDLNEIVVTKSEVIAFAYDAKNKRHFSMAKIQRSEIRRVSDSYMRFVTLEMADGSTHWIEVNDGKKAEFIKVLTPLAGT